MPLKQLVLSKLGQAGKGAATAQMTVYETWARWIARGLQFIFALIIVGLYGHRVDQDHKAGNPQASQWVFALIVGAMSCITCVIFAIPLPFMRTHRFFAWDFFLFILWIAVFGAFGTIYLHRSDDDPYQGTSTPLMKIAVWLDLINALFWFMTGSWGSFRTFVGKKVSNKVDSTMEKLGGGPSGGPQFPGNPFGGNRFGGNQV